MMYSPLVFFSYLEPAGWGRSCPTQSCYWPHKCSSQNPQLSLCEWQGCHYRGRCAGYQSQQVLGFHCWNTRVRISVTISGSAAVETVFTTSVCMFVFVLCSHLLQPLDGWRWITHCFTWQHNVPHPGGRYCSVEGQDPSRSCKNTHMPYQPTEEMQ